MSVNIFEDTKTSEIVIQTTCLDMRSFVTSLADAISTIVLNTPDVAVTMEQIMLRSMPIAFKLSGYKADEVREERTLVCGNVSPENCKIIAHGE
jgi:hypothetical protein